MMSSEVFIRIVMADNNPDRAAHTVQRLLEAAIMDEPLGREVEGTPIIMYADRKRRDDR